MSGFSRGGKLWDKKNENMYVFPGDLLNHCENLKDIGTIKQ